MGSDSFKNGFMKECEVPQDTVMGKTCRRILGSGIESCYLWSEVEGESMETVKYLQSLVDRASGCPFQQKALERIAGYLQY